MKKILLSIRGFENNTIFTYKDSNHFNGFWQILKNNLAKINYNLTTVDQNNLDDAAYILFQDAVSLGIPKREFPLKAFIKKLIKNNHSAPKMRELYKECISLGLKDKMILILWEPSVVDPDNYTQDLFDKFNTILTWNDDLVDNKKFFKFYHPYSGGNRPTPTISFAKKKLLVNISMNKYSNHPDDLYRMRRRSISFFEKNTQKEFDLFGYGWNSPARRIEKLLPFLVKKHSNYRGTCENKHEVLAQYKFSLCYENIRGVKGWITEKIFDCFQARTVPIYWGAENITDYIPKNTFIDRREFSTDAELLTFITHIDKETYATYIEAIETFIKSDGYKIFLPEEFFNTIIRTLKI